MEIYELEFTVWALVNYPVFLDMLGNHDQTDIIMFDIVTTHVKISFEILEGDKLLDLKSGWLEHVLLPYILLHPNLSVNWKSLLVILSLQAQWIYSIVWPFQLDNEVFYVVKFVFDF